PPPPPRRARPAAPPPQPAPAASAPRPPPAAATAGPVAATPATRRLARELGVDLRAVRGSGPGGRVLDADVQAAATGPRAAAPPPAEPRAGAPVREATPAGPGQPLATIGLEPPPLPRFEQWGPVE